MKQSRPSNAPSGMDPSSAAIPNADATPVGLHDGPGAEAFVVHAYEAHSAELFGFLARATGDRAVAEDLLQAAYLRLADEARRGRPPAQARGWLYRVATNLVIGRSSRPAASRRAPPAAVMSRERATELDRALDGLSADARVALLLSSQGFAGAEIAAAMGRSEAATRTLLGRARARVRLRRELFANGAG
jgi:RNA polymerase sigma factor (sigma-70 family)